jgi:CRISPR-associated protein Csb2
MTVLELRFPAGRYHATPWGRHVNEGAIEWPPSPWRIVRALIATWYLKARLEIPEATVRALTNVLSHPPEFRLPRASTGHTRHFMPINQGKKTAKVFDTFVQFSEKDAVLVAWDVTLSLDQLAVLQTLAERLGYFGRAESLVEACVRTDLPEKIEQTHSVSALLIEGTPQPPKTELVRLLAPMTPAGYKTWHTDFLSANAPPANGKKNDKKRVKAPEAPDDLFTALHADTGELQTAGWNLPPGALYVNYIRPENAFAPTTRSRAPRSGPQPIVARYAVVSAVAPSIMTAVSVAARVHDALCKWSDQSKGRATVFTGLDGDGKPSTDHRHAHIFCEANGPRDAITHITIWATMGFDEAACLALRKLNKVWGHSGHDIRLVLYGIGGMEDFKECPLFAVQKPAKVWRSLTPFVSTRHAKTFHDGRPKMDASGWQTGSAAHDLLRLLALHPQGTAATIKQCDERERPFQFGNRHLRSLQFQTIRHDGGGNRGNSSGNAFIITFPEPVIGPLAFGYGAHFGLGLFVPIRHFAGHTVLS